MAKTAETPQLQPADFVHLHNHTQFSLLDGLTQLEPLMNRTAEFGMQAVAMTDHGTMSGAIEFYSAGRNQNINPIIGMEAYVATRKHTDKDPTKDKFRYHLILLAMNNTGYKNLMKLSSIANLDGFYYYPRIDHDLLEKYNEGLIVLSGCMSGEVGEALKQGDYKKAAEIASWYKSVFGDRYYLEVQDHGHPDNPKHNQEQEAINDLVLRLGEELDIPAVVTCDAHYLKPEDEDAHEILLCVGTGSFLSDENRMSLKDFPLFVENPTAIIKRWGEEHPELVLNTSKIAKRCEVNIELGNYLIPKFPVPKGQTEKSYLVQLTFQGLVRRYNPDQSDEGSIAQLKARLSQEIVQRAEYELSVIDRMGFNGYFLIVQDFINWGKNEGIVFGPGRGSGAGSIVAYGLRITELDPIVYDLLFERFLNPDRISMPDFDIDIQDTRRDEVIQYCVNKYGTDRVANIVTYGRMFARNAVRDVARVLQVPYAEADRLAKMIPPPVQGRHIPLETSLRENIELAHEYRINADAKRVLDQALRLEGTIRSHGVHAAGVVIAPDDIVNYTPLEMAQKGVVTTQYAMGPIEDLGLLKMDFLGLSNLTIIKNTLRIIKKVHRVDIELSTLPLNDKKTYELLTRGDTTGVFQLESAGMKRYLKQLKPTVFEDIIAMVALYRPGPMQWIEDFIARKHGKRKIEYFHQAMEEALQNTYGVIVYQEQVMQISKDLCGFTGGQADTLRKGIAKKIPAVLKKMKKEFIDGAIAHSKADPEAMEKFWQQLEDFAAYCFNKAHAACYAMIAYQTAYLKAHYPAEFMAALMTSDFDDIDRLAIEIAECKHMGIDVLPPDINESFLEFAVVPDKNQIRFGLRAIKNVGANAVEEILQERKKSGRFASMEEFLSKVGAKAVNRKSLESLVKSGAFDNLGDRRQLVENLDVLTTFAAKTQKNASTGQTDLFGASEEGEQFKTALRLAPASNELTLNDELSWERELLGLYLSQHPLEQYEALLAKQTMPLNTLEKAKEGKVVTVGGSINETREIVTKNGKKMAFVKLADQFGEIEAIVFPDIYQENISLWQRDKVVIAKGKLSNKDRSGNETTEWKLLVEKASLLTSNDIDANSSNQTSNATARLYVRLDTSEDEKRLLSLKKTIDEFPGDTEVVLVIGQADKRIIRLPDRIAQKEGLAKLQEIVGEEHVKVSV